MDKIRVEIDVLNKYYLIKFVKTGYEFLFGKFLYLHSTQRCGSGSGIQFFYPWIRDSIKICIWDPRSGNRDKRLGSYFQSLVTLFW